MSEQLKVGDTVRLKSGGPLMTIVSIWRDDEGTRVRCSWFANDKEDSGSFPAASVAIDDDAPMIA